VSIDAEGTGIVETSKKHWRFEYAVFLSGRRDIRLAALDKCIAAHTLSTHDRERLRQLAGQPDITNDDFAVLAEIVASSPESFAFMLRERVVRAKIEKNDLLPHDLRHWEHLVPPAERSTTLDQYIASELEAEWRARLTVSQPLGLASIALTFAAPALIPRGLIESLPLDKAVAFLEAACAFDDPFGLVGALQTCADRVVGDARLVMLGERLLDRLFGNMDRLTTACQLFAAAFIIATAHLSEHETLGRQPVYWRRLAAASHASLVVRTCGISDAKQDGLIPWAGLVSGDTYILSVLSDFSEQPRWRPEWITDDFLVADIYGRALSALSGIPSEHVPASWQTRLDQVKAWAYKTPMEIKATFIERGKANVAPARQEHRIFKAPMLLARLHNSGTFSVD
jgi:hypothetical protein